MKIGRREIELFVTRLIAIAVRNNLIRVLGGKNEKQGVTNELCKVCAMYGD